jgi:hypothetical protein
MFTFENAGYQFASSTLSQAEIASQVAVASPKYHTLKSDDPIKLDLKRGIVKRVAESKAGSIEAYMVYNKDSDSYLAVEKPQYDKHKGEKYHRTIGFIVSTLEKPTELSKLKDKAKKESIISVREPVRMYANTVFNRLEKAVKDITDPKPEGEKANAVEFQLWADNLVKTIKARRKTSEAREDLVPSEKWLDDNVIKPMQVALKGWYMQHDKKTS